MADAGIDAQQTPMLDSGNVQLEEQVAVVVPITQGNGETEINASDILQQALQEASDELEGGQLAYATVEERVAAIHGEVLETKTDDQQPISAAENVVEESSEEPPQTVVVSQESALEESFEVSTCDVTTTALVSEGTFGAQETQNSVVQSNSCPDEPDKIPTSIPSGTHVTSASTVTETAVVQGTGKENYRVLIKPGPRSNLAIRSNATSILKSKVASVSHTDSSLLRVPLPKSSPAALSRSSGGTHSQRSSLSSKSTAAPLGSSENPIQIIQQGNTYHSTQVLTRDQLQQIAHVLQQQQVTRAVQNGGSAVLYNPATNTRIIYRVIYPSELGAGGKTPIAKKSSTGVGRGGGSGNTSGGTGRGRGRPRKNLLKKPEDEDSRQEVPELSRAEKEEKKKHRPRTRSGRISRPPSYMVKDYKRIHHLDFDEEPYDDSDGGYSDFQLSDEDGEHRHKHSLPPGVSTSKPRKYKCSTCEKAYIGKGGLARHYRMYPSHGSLPDNDDVSTHDENSNSSLTSTRSSTSFQRSTSEPSFIGTVPSSVKEDMPTSSAGAPRSLSHYQELASIKRKNRLKEFLRHCRDEELMEVVLPRLSQVITLWEFLLMKCEKGDPAEPDVSDILKNFESLIKHLQKFTKECLSPADSQKDDDSNCVKITSDAVAQVLGLPTGTYNVKLTETSAGNAIRSKQQNSNYVSPQKNMTVAQRIVRVISKEERGDSPPSKKQKIDSSQDAGKSIANITVTINNVTDQLTNIASDTPDSKPSSLQGRKSINPIVPTLKKASVTSIASVLANSANIVPGISQFQTNVTSAALTSVVSTCPTSIPATLLVSSNPICSTLPIQDIRVRKVHILGCEARISEGNSTQPTEVYENVSANNATEVISVTDASQLALICASTAVSNTCTTGSVVESGLLTNKTPSHAVVTENGFALCSSSLNGAVVVSMSDVLGQQVQAQVVEAETDVLNSIVTNSAEGSTIMVQEAMDTEDGTIMVHHQMATENSTVLVQEERADNENPVRVQPEVMTKHGSVIEAQEMTGEGETIMVQQEIAPEGTAIMVQQEMATEDGNTVMIQHEMATESSDAMVQHQVVAMKSSDTVSVQQQVASKGDAIVVQQQEESSTVMVQHEAMDMDGSCVMIKQKMVPTESRSTVVQEDMPTESESVINQQEMVTENSTVLIQNQPGAAGDSVMAPQEMIVEGRSVLINQGGASENSPVIVQQVAVTQGDSEVVNHQALSAQGVVDTAAGGDSFVSSIHVMDGTGNHAVMLESSAEGNVAVAQVEDKVDNQEQVVCSGETMLTTATDETAVVRHLMLPDGQIIGTVASTDGQLESLAALGEQGFLPGNVIIVQNPDGSTTLQVPSDQPIPLETVQALLAMDQSLAGAEIAEGVQVVQQEEVPQEGHPVQE